MTDLYQREWEYDTYNVPFALLSYGNEIYDLLQKDRSSVIVPEHLTLEEKIAYVRSQKPKLNRQQLNKQRRLQQERNQRQQEEQRGSLPF